MFSNSDIRVLLTQACSVIKTIYLDFSSFPSTLNKEVIFSSLASGKMLIIGNPLDCLLYSGIS